MNIIVALISVSITIAVGFLVSFLWSLRSGQFDDTYSPSVRMLFDDQSKKKNTSSDPGKLSHVQKADKSQSLS